MFRSCGCSGCDECSGRVDARVVMSVPLVWMLGLDWVFRSFGCSGCDGCSARVDARVVMGVPLVWMLGL